MVSIEIKVKNTGNIIKDIFNGMYDKRDEMIEAGEPYTSPEIQLINNISSFTLGHEPEDMMKGYFTQK